MSKELFGDDFDDDDFDDPEDRDANLNAYGAQIRNSLKKEKEKASDLRRERDVDKSAFASRLAAAASTATKGISATLQPNYRYCIPIISSDIVRTSP